ncbi:MAG: tetratricopeptide repeat protein [Myxococcota bacterium]|jgi:hypothetical protein|nr:tetratricopeptide repeat protein [Myxococcota bacterium]
MMNYQMAVPTLCLAASLLLVLPWRASAEVDPALQAYQQATAAFNAGNYGDAASSFRKAMELRPSWKIRYNIAQSEASLKHYDLALEEFEAYLIEGGDDITGDRQAEVMGEIKRLRMLVATVELAGAEQGEVFVNGIARGALPEASRIKTTAGKIEITIRKGNKTIITKVLRVTGGDTVRLDVNVGSDDAAATTAPQAATSSEGAPMPPPRPEVSVPPEPRISKSRAVGWTLAGLGAATLATGVVLGGVALSKASHVEDQCKDGHCPKSSEDEAKSSRGLALSADICFGVGAAMAIIGGLLGFGVFSKRETSKVAATPIEGGGMLVVTGSL